LLASWGLPLQLVEAVAFHHTPGSVVDPDSLEVLAAVHVADVLSDARAYRSADPLRDGKLDCAFISSAALDAKLVEWRALVGSLPA
jgi:HD-like signal output (HDOD) protein